MTSLPDIPGLDALLVIAAGSAAKWIWDLCRMGPAVPRQANLIAVMFLAIIGLALYQTAVGVVWTPQLAAATTVGGVLSAAWAHSQTNSQQDAKRNQKLKRRGDARRRPESQARRRDDEIVD